MHLEIYTQKNLEQGFRCGLIFYVLYRCIELYEGGHAGGGTLP